MLAQSNASPVESEILNQPEIGLTLADLNSASLGQQVRTRVNSDDSSTFIVVSSQPSANLNASRSAQRTTLLMKKESRTALASQGRNMRNYTI